MSEGSSRTFSVGLLAAVGLAVVAVGIFLVGSEQRFWGGRTSYWLHFSRTNGLLEGAPVALNGLTVGSVVRMGFPSDPLEDYVDVKIAVASNVARRIRRDTVGKIQTLGLLGDKYIELSAGSLGEEPVASGGLIRSLDPVDYEALVSQSGDIVTNAIEVTALLRQVLTDINNGEGVVGRLVSDRDFGQQFAGTLSRTVTNLESSTATLDALLSRVESGDGALGALMSENSSAAEIIENLLEVSRQARHFSSNLNEGRGLIARLTADEGLADRTLADIESATTSIAAVAAQVRSGEGSLGRLVYDDSLYENADRLVGGGSGGFWRLLGRGAAFFWPFGGGRQAAAGAAPLP